MRKTARAVKSTQPTPTSPNAPATGRRIARARALRTAAGWLAVLALAGCDLPGKPNPADRPVPVEDVLEFSVLYSTRCAGCHGADGRLGPAPPINDPLYLSLASDAEIRRIVESGRGAEYLMPAFGRAHGGPLSEAQTAALVAGIKSRWRPDPTPPAEGALPPSLDAPTSPADPAAGAAVYARACAGCHGDQGQGGEFESRAIGAINDPAFLALISPRALQRLIVTGRPDLGMPDYAGRAGRPPDFPPLSSKDVGDLLAHLLLWRDLPELKPVPPAPEPQNGESP